MAKKELSPEIRVVLAFAISLLILLVLQPLLVRKSPPTGTESKPAAQPAAQTAQTPPPPAEIKAADNKPSDSKAATGEPAAAVAAAVKQGEREELVTVEGDLYRVVFSTRGAVVKSWQLKKFKDAKNGPLELLNENASRQFGQPLLVWSGDQALRDKVNGALFVPSATGTLHAPVTLTFEYSNGGITARKQISFKPDHYDVSITSNVARDGKPLNHQLAWRGSFGDIHDTAVRGTLVDVFYRDQENKMTRLLPTNLAQQGFWTRLFNGLGATLGLVDRKPPITEVTQEGPLQFAGIEDHFFTASVLPDGKPLKVTAFSHELAVEGQSRPTIGIGFAAGTPGDGPTTLRMYVGPKESTVLASAQPELAQLVDYGWFTIIATPLYHSLRWIHDHIVANYGWSIILLTLVINLLLLPLKLSSFRSARKMQALAPQLRSIQDKYKGLKMNDPKRQQMSQETMQLYQKHGVNPVGGCLPLIVQLPFLIGFYNVLRNSIEMRHAEWIAPWITDLSTPENIQFPLGITFRILPLIMVATQFAMQRLTPTPGVDPMQQKMMMMMPVMFLFMFWGQASGLVLYWTVGNLVGIAQQYYFNRTHQLQEVEARLAKKAKKAK